MKKVINWARLFKTSTFWTEKIQNDLFGQVTAYLEKSGKTKQDFAKELGVSKGYVSQILNGQFDHKLSKLVELYLAVGKAPLIISADLDAYTIALQQGITQEDFIKKASSQTYDSPQTISNQEFTISPKPIVEIKVSRKHFPPALTIPRYQAKTSTSNVIH